MPMKLWARTFPKRSSLPVGGGKALLCTCLLTCSLQAEWKARPADEWNDEVRVWDPSPELKLNFTWTGGANASEEAEGQGTLTWSDEKGPVSIYVGDLSGGKRNGNGNWLHRSGSKYSGSWKNNLKHGEGEYWLKYGDYYKGGFLDDKLHGTGKYVFADGSVYEGQFANGEKQGSGKLTFPDGRVHQSTWEKDQDTSPPPPATEPYVVLGIDNRKYALDGNVIFSGEAGSHECYLTYRGRWADGEYFIAPDWPYWEKWQKGGPIGETGNFDVGVYPVFLEMRLYNPSKENLTISSAEIDVQTSRPDNEPILEVGDGFAQDFNAYATLSMTVSSLYRQPVQTFEISFNLLPVGKQPVFGNYEFKVDVPSFTGGTVVSLAEAVAELGGKTELFKEWEALNAGAEKPNTDFEALEKRKSSLLNEIRSCLGPLKQFEVIDKANNTMSLEARFVGEMTVCWEDAEGAEKSKVVKLDFVKTFFVSSLEFGAGGPESGKYDVLLETNGKNYVKPFGYKRTLEPGENDRFVIQLASTASSYQNFKVRLTTTDGRELLSPACAMHFLVPGGYDWNTGFTVNQ